MPTPTTLLEFATQERDWLQSAHAAAQAELAAAQAELTDASSEVTDAAELAAELAARIADARARLAVTTVPADASELLDEIADLIIEQRTLQGQILEYERAVAAARSRVSAARKVIQRTAAELAAAQTALAEAEQAHARRQAWKTALGEPPLSTLPADAAAELSGDRFTAAEAAIQALPEKIRQTAASRYDTYVARVRGERAAVDAARDLLAAENGSSGGTSGAATQQQIAFERAESALRDFATRAVDRFAAAVALLEAAADGPLLSDAEAEQIADTMLTAAGESAADLGIARDNAQRVLDERLRILEDVTLQKRAASPGADVSGDPDVQNAQNDVDAARTDLEAAQAAFEAERAALAAWLTVVPDRAWRRVRAFHDAVATLTELSAVDPAALVTEIDSAEQALAAALATASERRRALLLLQDDVDLRVARWTAAESARDTSTFSAVRGDR